MLASNPNGILQNKPEMVFVAVVDPIQVDKTLVPGAKTSTMDPKFE